MREPMDLDDVPALSINTCFCCKAGKADGAASMSNMMKVNMHKMKTEVQPAVFCGIGTRISLERGSVGT